MRIGIDASRTTVAKRTGTENYSLRLLRELISLESGHEFVFYFREAPTPGTFPEHPSVSYQVIPIPRLWTHLGLSWEMLTSAPDVLFVPAHVLPVVHPTRTVVTIHDLGYLYHRHAHHPLDWCHLYLSTLFNARAADRVIADSEATRRDLVDRYLIDPDKITTIHLAQDEVFQPVEQPDVLAAIQTKYGITGDYFLALGTVQPRKNLMGTIAAFAVARRKFGIKQKLVIAGKKGWLSESIYKKARSLGIEDDVLFTGYVEQTDLPALFSGATALVFISLYEGFGLPSLEAMACGTPVIASNVSSLPEVVGDAGLLVDPQDISGAADALMRLATDPVLHAQLSAKGLAQARRFSWRKCAEETLQVLLAAAN